MGRTANCALRLTERHVSGEHATLVWTGAHWEVRDLGSRNGTFVNGRRVEPGVPVALQPGNHIAFGHKDDTWEFAEAGPPSAVAERLDSNELTAAIDGILALPNYECPEVVVFADPGGRWILEAGESDARQIEDGEVVQAGGASWRVRLPHSQEGTAALERGVNLDTVTLRFAVSRDEEHVQMTAVSASDEIHLEAREHSYVLLTLARARLEDAALPPSEQGWVDRDTLLRMLGLDGNALNVAIYRARGQLSASGIEGAAGVVEVRRGQRRIGVEPQHIVVVPL